MDQLTGNKLLKLKLAGFAFTLVIFLLCCYRLETTGKNPIISIIISFLVSSVFYIGFCWICAYEERFQLASEIRKHEETVLQGLYRFVAEGTEGRGRLEKEKIGLRYCIRIYYIGADSEEQKRLLNLITRYLKSNDELHICFRVEITGAEDTTENDNFN